MSENLFYWLYLPAWLTQFMIVDFIDSLLSNLTFYISALSVKFEKLWISQNNYGCGLS